MLAAVRTSLTENGVELPQLFWRRLRTRKKGTKALTMDRVPSNVELRRILTHMAIQGKALYLLLASSGMRIGEALKLKLSDLALGEDPAKINIRGEYTKSGNPRLAFLSSEAKEALEEWLKVRPHYILRPLQVRATGTLSRLKMRGFFHLKKIRPSTCGGPL